jgi:hypothetical protein
LVRDDARELAAELRAGAAGDGRLALGRVTCGDGRLALGRVTCGRERVGRSMVKRSRVVMVGRTGLIAGMDRSGRLNRVSPARGVISVGVRSGWPIEGITGRTGSIVGRLDRSIGFLSNSVLR